MVRSILPRKLGQAFAPLVCCCVSLFSLSLSPSPSLCVSVSISLSRARRCRVSLGFLVLSLHAIIVSLGFPATAVFCFCRRSASSLCCVINFVVFRVFSPLVLTSVDCLLLAFGFCKWNREAEEGEEEYSRKTRAVSKEGENANERTRDEHARELDAAVSLILTIIVRSLCDGLRGRGLPQVCCSSGFSPSIEAPCLALPF